MSITPSAWPDTLVTNQQTKGLSPADEIIVSARKRTEPLQRVPISITALTGTQLVDRNLMNLMEVGPFAPNVITATAPGGSGGGNQGQIYIRGIGQLDYLATTDPGVGIYLDGVYHPRSLGAITNLLDIDRVEILRGPQGTLWGKNTLGGAIHVVSQAPVNDRSGYAEITIGSFDRFDGRATFNLPLIEERLLTRFAVAYQKRDGYGKVINAADGTMISETGDIDHLGGRAVLRWLLSNRFTLDVVIDYSRERQGTVPTKLLEFDDSTAVPVNLWNTLIGQPAGQPFNSDFIVADENISFGDGPNRNDLDQGGISATFDADLSFVQLRSITAYRQMDGTVDSDADGAPVPILEPDQRTKQHQVSQELQLFGSAFKGRLDWLIGLYYFDETIDDHIITQYTVGQFDALESLPAPIDGSPCTPPFVAPGCAGNPINAFLDLEFDVNYDLGHRSMATFGQVTLALTDRIGFTTGLRLTREDKEMGLTLARVPSGTFVVDDANVNESWTVATPMFALEFTPRDNLLTYVSASRGFKSGGFNGRPTTGEAELEPFDPEYLWSYELGVKSRWFDDQLLFNAAGFYYDYDDVQFTIASADPQTGTTLIVVGNAGKARATGFEAELSARPVAGLSLTAGLGYIDFEYTDIAPDVLAVTRDTRQPQTPEWTVNAGAQYRWSVGSGTLTPRIDWVYQTESFVDIQNTAALKVDEHSIFNARLEYDIGLTGWQIAGFVTNLTDERVIVNGVNGLAAFGLVSGFYNRPREWGISLSGRF